MYYISKSAWLVGCVNFVGALYLNICDGLSAVCSLNNIGMKIKTVKVTANYLNALWKKEPRSVWQWMKRHPNGRYLIYPLNIPGRMRLAAVPLCRGCQQEDEIICMMVL